MPGIPIAAADQVRSARSVLENQGVNGTRCHLLAMLIPLQPDSRCLPAV
jgi:hypothetical protein